MGERKRKPRKEVDPKELAAKVARFNRLNKTLQRDLGDPIREGEDAEAQEDETKEKEGD